MAKKQNFCKKVLRHFNVRLLCSHVLCESEVGSGKKNEKKLLTNRFDRDKVLSVADGNNGRKKVQKAVDDRRS
jgi:hypothetical protein